MLLLCDGSVVFDDFMDNAAGSLALLPGFFCGRSLCLFDDFEDGVSLDLGSW